MKMSPIFNPALKDAFMNRSQCLIAVNEKRRSAFSLIEVLVVIALIALLTAILMPALSSAREAANRRICASNLHSIGQALNAYQHDHAERLPPHFDRWGPKTETYDIQYLEPWISSVAYHKDQIDFSGGYRPLQLAYLYQTRCIENPAVFYCPSQGTAGDNLLYTYSYYTSNGKSWGTFMPMSAPGRYDDKIRLSYNYWLHGKSSLNFLTIHPIVFDNILHWNTIAHSRGSKPFGFNALYGDGHVNFSHNRSLFELPLWNGGPDAPSDAGPGSSQSLFIQILRRF